MSSLIRKPAVAGQFYPDDPNKLRSVVRSYLSTKTPLTQSPVILISPHAGYVYSGAVAAQGYAALDPSINRVIIIGPSHHAWFDGIAVTGFEAWETPLGVVAVDTDATNMLLRNPWAHIVPEADLPEHSLEVHLPFLQEKLSSFSIIPILTGNVDPGKVAALLLPLVTRHTLIIASSDLSHFKPDTKAQSIDKITVATILSKNSTGFIDACGERPIRVAMSIAQSLSLEPQRIVLQNSYQAAPHLGSSNRVVGYVTIAYIGAVTMTAFSCDISSDIKLFLLKTARSSLDAAVSGNTIDNTLNKYEITQKNSGCFVTLTKNGRLRGCIGFIEPIKPLYIAVIENAKNAALHDPRFPRVQPEELGDITVEVSVLSEPVALKFSSPEDLLNKIQQGKDGIILEHGYNRSTFLPQVWDQLPDKVKFLEALAQKGGMSKDGWKSATVKRYAVTHFSE